MNIEEIRDYCLSKANAEECLPFGPGTVVFKTSGKIFLLLAIDVEPAQFNVKCNPEKAILLREEFDCILPGYHMNKKHWNTIVLDGSLSRAQLQNFIDHSFDLLSPKAYK